jgi:hypothetical protein
MFYRDRAWQNKCQCEQDSFIHENLLMIGYFAWQGFIQFGSGLTVCNRVMDNADNRPLMAPLMIQYVAGAKEAEYLREEGIEEEVITSIQSAVRQYNPQRDLVLMLSAPQQLEIWLLQNLAITPPECHTQVCNRWAEFMTGKTLMDRSYGGTCNV